MRKQLIWSFILVSFFCVYVMPERVLAGDTNSSSGSYAVGGVLIAVAVIAAASFFMPSLPSDAQNTRAKDPEALNKSRESISTFSAFDLGISSENSFISSDKKADNRHAIALHF